jgi:hypothetical protein
MTRFSLVTGEVVLAFDEADAPRVPYLVEVGSSGNS